MLEANSLCKNVFLIYFWQNMVSLPRLSFSKKPLNFFDTFSQHLFIICCFQKKKTKTLSLWHWHWVWGPCTRFALFLCNVQHLRFITRYLLKSFTIHTPRAALINLDIRRFPIEVADPGFPNGERQPREEGLNFLPKVAWKWKKKT